ncbi:hypothetical protein BDZ89DRAFT_1072767 [Hymenopellis radicata]|nr:hypothetical protein BDZ89DRAFT_1072767 [Hymenopellis radicata]
MRARCNNFVLGLENAVYDPVAPLVHDIFRGTNVRVEREPRKHGSKIIPHLRTRWKWLYSFVWCERCEYLDLWLNWRGFTVSETVLAYL